jgi:hypothetical protein
MFPDRFRRPLLLSRCLSPWLHGPDGRSSWENDPSTRAAWYRPAHIHFLIGAAGYREVVTALYISGDAHIDSDTVFGVTESLITTLKQDHSSSPIPNLPSLHYDFQLAAEAKRDLPSGRVGADPSQITKKVSIAIPE